MPEPTAPVPPVNEPPPPCDQDVFKNGHGICCVDARMHQMEAWVKKVAERSGQRVDWHYSGGIANVLYLGSYSEVMKAIMALEPELDGQIMRLYTEGAHGLYRAGDPVPEGTLAIDNSTGFSTPIIADVSDLIATISDAVSDDDP
jgi:hypothetical protein